MRCPQCDTESPEHAKFCLSCGARLSVVCPRCGATLLPQARYCIECGIEVGAPSPPEPPVSAPGFLTERLLRMVPQEYAERLVATRGQAPSERRLVTILFTDVKGSTAMAEALDPEDVMEIMSGAFERLIEPVIRHEGTVARLMGDAVLAFFGAPLSHEDDAQRACLAALEIVAGIRQYAARLEEERCLSGFDVRVGINTGLVVVGEVGSDLRVEYTAMGDAINVAARLEQNAPPGSVLISWDTYRHVRGLFDVVAQEPLAAKGKAEPLQTYVVQRARPYAFRRGRRGVEGIDTRMVGREAELERLREAFEAVVEDGECRVVTVVGEAGVGKSRLLDEFALWTELQPEELNRYKGRVDREMRRQPYALLRSLFSFRFGIYESDTAGAARDKLVEGLAAGYQAEDTGTQAEAEIKAHVTGQLLGFDFGSSPHMQSIGEDAQQLRDRALIYLVDYFRAMAAGRPVLMLLEDLHWADESSLDAVERLAASLSLGEVGAAPVLVLCAARPSLYERRPEWGTKRDFFRRLDLSPLSKVDSRHLVEEILQRLEEVPELLRDLVVSGAEGNPFYVEELIKMLIEEGVICKGEAAWSVEEERLSDLQVPPTLTGVLQARLDRLPFDQRQVLQQASVVGRLFWDLAVAHIAAAAQTEPGADEVARALAALQGREMVFPEAISAIEGAHEYLFKHAMLREVTYEGVLKRVRRVYHGLVADWLIEQGGDRVAEITGLIADHLALAGRAVEAINYLLQAGDRARNLYAHTEAIFAYERALALQQELGDDKEAARTLMKLGLSHDTTFDFRRAQQAFQEGLALWQRAEVTPPAVPPPPAPHALRSPWAEPPALDPTRGSHPVIDHLFSGLVELTEDLDIVPDVAQSWEVSGGGRTYTFHLRGDVVWSDGVPVTAHDFACAWRRILELDPVTGSFTASELFDVAGARVFHEGQGRWEDVGIRAVDDRTLVLELEAPTGYVLHLVAWGSLAPVPRHVVQDRGESWARSGELVSNGPFRLVSRSPGERMILERNPRFHGRYGGNVDRVELVHRVYGSPSEGLPLYEADGLDVLPLFFLRPVDRDRARQRHAGELVSVQDPGMWYLGMHPRLSPFDDVRVRQAFAQSIDREQLAPMTADLGLPPYAGGLLPPGVPGHSPGIALPYDPDRALYLLAEAGYPGGAGFPAVTALTADYVGPGLEALAALWRETLGIHVDLEVVDYGSFIDRLHKELPHMYLASMSPRYPHPNIFLRVAVRRLTRQWRCRKYDELVEQAGRGADQEERMKLYRQADRMLVEEAIVLPLGPARLQRLIKPWVSRYPLSPFRRVHWQDVVIEPH